ncbi:protein TIFY 10A-like [Rutidosis leptorrhynchoides]|uniref:protein TIFY 10A-like n=1 Tax=Rutidosis leptorrhynchoides TaxID=125765 RepID=UPI003A997A0C
MSASKHHFSGTGDGMSKFVNRLSLYLKETRNLHDISVGINAKFDPKPNTDVLKSPHQKATTTDLLSNTKNSGKKAKKSVEIAPEYIILDSSCELDDSTIQASSSKAVTKAKTVQMTIFYGGQVIVLDDVSENRAKDLIQMVRNGEAKEKIDNQIKLASTTSKSKDSIKGELQGKDSDLPIARRASLHKFLAKRKDRAMVRPAPYPEVHYNHSPGGSSSGNEHSFDLNM